MRALAPRESSFKLNHDLSSVEILRWEFHGLLVVIVVPGGEA
jgi:hypothetical protein